LVIAHHLLVTGALYQDPGPDIVANNTTEQIRKRAIRQLENLGLQGHPRSDCRLGNGNRIFRTEGRNDSSWTGIESRAPRDGGGEVIGPTTPSYPGPGLVWPVGVVP
ncbi:MAG: hypothetical protein ACRDWA_10185, partial [Acidimicrobiia bacterium]